MRQLWSFIQQRTKTNSLINTILSRVVGNEVLMPGKWTTASTFTERSV